MQPLLALLRCDEAVSRDEGGGGGIAPVVAMGLVVGIDDHAGGHGGVGEAVDHDETAGGGIFLVRVKHDRLVEAQRAAANFVEGQAGGGAAFNGVDVDGV